MSREMKKVPIDFADSIPTEWECSRLKYHCKITNGSDPKTEGDIPVYGSGSEIVKYCGEFKNGPAILIGRKGTLDKPKLVEGKYWNVDTAMDLHPYAHMSPKYLYYVISCFTIDKYSTCTAKPSMTQGDYYNIPIPVPSNLEQKSIATFLDSKCEAIDQAIQKQKDIVYKLMEYRQSTITQAVTKGLNPDAKTQEFNFLWLKEMPKNWGIYKLSHILDFNHPYPLGDGDHGSIKANDYITSGIPLLRVQNLGYAEPIKKENMVYISAKQNETIKNSTLRPNDILFAKTGATIGKTAIITEEMPIANTTSHIGKITVDTNKFYPKYIYYVISSEVGNFQLWSIAGKKATRPEVGLDEVRYIKFLVPKSIEEQQQIAKYLDGKCSKIDQAIQRSNKIIQKLEEYKKSLIYNAVTGKIDCRGEVK